MNVMLTTESIVEVVGCRTRNQEPLVRDSVYMCGHEFLQMEHDLLLALDHPVQSQSERRKKCHHDLQSFIVTGTVIIGSLFGKKPSLTGVELMTVFL